MGEHRAIDQDEPGFANQFPPSASPSENALLTTADVYLGELEPPSDATKAAKAAPNALAAKFIAHELPDDFVQNLRDDRDAIAEARDTLEAGDQSGIESTA